MFIKLDDKKELEVNVDSAEDTSIEEGVDMLQLWEKLKDGKTTTSKQKSNFFLKF